MGIERTSVAFARLAVHRSLTLAHCRVYYLMDMCAKHVGMTRECWGCIKWEVISIGHDIADQTLVYQHD